MSVQLLEATFYVTVEDDGAFGLYTKDPEAVERLWKAVLGKPFTATPAMDRVLGSGVRFSATNAATRPLPQSH